MKTIVVSEKVMKPNPKDSNDLMEGRKRAVGAEGVVSRLLRELPSVPTIGASAKAVGPGNDEVGNETYVTNVYGSVKISVAIK